MKDEDGQANRTLHVIVTTRPLKKDSRVANGRRDHEMTDRDELKTDKSTKTPRAKMGIKSKLSGRK